VVEETSITTKSREELINIDGAVSDILTIFVPHTTAAVTIGWSPGEAAIHTVKVTPMLISRLPSSDRAKGSSSREGGLFLGPGSKRPLQSRWPFYQL
jgi:hypothetical protein